MAVWLQAMVAISEGSQAPEVWLPLPDQQFGKKGQVSYIRFGLMVRGGMLAKNSLSAIMAKES